MRTLAVLLFAGWCACAGAGTPVGLNHFYVVLDDPTFAAVRDSEFLKTQFAAIDAGLPTFSAPQPGSQRLYIRGRTTYMEFLGPKNPFGEPVGKVGIALGVDDLSHLDGIQRAWQARIDGTVQRHRIEWTKSTPPTPWYEVVQHPGTADNEHAVLWASAYRPEFLPWLYPQRSAQENRGSRADFLAPQFRPGRLFIDVVGLTIAVPAALLDRISAQFVAIGYRREVSDGSVRLETDGWTLTLMESAAARRGLLRIDMTITNSADPFDRQLGPRSKIKFGNRQIASWEFE